MFLALFALELRRAPEGPRRPALGWALLAVALAAELLLVAGGLTRAARPLVALAAFGMGWIQGRPPPRATALLLWFVPIPSGVVSRASPALESFWGEAAAGLAQLVGSSVVFELHHDVPTLVVGAAALSLEPSDGGLSLVALLSGLAWYAGLRRGASLAATLARAGASAALAAPIQVIAIAGAALVASAGGPARMALEVAPWALVTCLGLGWVWRTTRGHAEPLSSPPR